MATPEKNKPQPRPWSLVRMLRGTGHAMLVVPCGFFSKAQFPLVFSINAGYQPLAGATRALPASLPSSWQSTVPLPAAPPAAAGDGGAGGGGGGGGKGQAQTSGGLLCGLCLVVWRPPPPGPPTGRGGWGHYELCRRIIYAGGCLGSDKY